MESVNEPDTQAISVPYSKFLFKHSLRSVFRRAGLIQKNEDPTNITLGNDQDTDAMIVSLAFDVTLFLNQTVYNRKVVFNSSGSTKMFITQTADALFTFKGEDDGSYTHLDRPPADVEMATTDFLTPTSESEWRFETFSADAVKGDHKANVRRATDSGPLTNDGFDLIFKCSKGAQASVVEGYSFANKVTFDSVLVYTDKLNVPLVKIPNGLGICLINEVSDLFVLDSSYNPLQHVDLYSEISKFAKGVASPVTAPVLVNNPSVENMIAEDVKTRFPDLRVGEVEGGECTYHYVNNARGGVIDRSSLGHMVSSTDLTKQLLCLKSESSHLCMSIDALEKTLSAIDEHIPQGRSIVYRTVKRFTTFLYKVGYCYQLMQFDEPLQMFTMYDNVRTVINRLDVQNGTGQIDMEIFQPFYNRNPFTLTLTKWVEKSTGIKF